MPCSNHVQDIAFASPANLFGQFDPLRYAMQDRLHQQYRSHMFPFMPFIKAALEAGAHGAFLSGAGPTILAIAGGVGIADPGSDTMSQFLAEARCSPQEFMAAAQSAEGMNDMYLKLFLAHSETELEFIVTIAFKVKSLSLA